jgi:type IV secretion system protein VirB10
MRSMILLAMAASLAGAAQTTPQTASSSNTETNSQPAPASPSQGAMRQVTVPAGTEVLLQLKSTIDTKNAQVGDGVYCQTAFPVTVDNVIAIPGGTYVKGEIVKVERPGRVKGRAQVLFRFTSMIFPNGYTVDLPGTIHHDSGAANARVDDEGKITADSQKGKDAMTVLKGTGIGAAGGSLATGTRAGALGGAGVGAAAGLAMVLLTRGQDLRIEAGTSLKMLTQVPLTVDVAPLDPSRPATEVIPHPTTNNRLQPPPDRPNPK